MHPALMAAFVAAASTVVLVGLSRTERAAGRPTGADESGRDADLRATLPLDRAAASRNRTGQRRAAARKNFVNDPTSFYGRNMLSMREL